jgi:NADH-quinone oxidoreductase subunit C
MFDEILALVTDVAKHSPSVDENASPKAIRIHGSDVVAVCQLLYTNPKTYFDLLSCITAIDNGPQAGTIDIAYNLYSIPYNIHLMLKTTIQRDNPEMDTVSFIWKTANWHEREIFDLFGVTFRNHPDLRRILLPADWVGHPLRKDYKHEEYYKNIKVDY